MAFTCDEGPELDWRNALEPGGVVVLGEMHGTKEGPAFVAAAACTALKRGRRVAVALEWPDGVDLVTPENSDFLATSKQSGRQSEAMVALARQVTAWKDAGAPVQLLFIDPADEARDVGMAAAVRTWHTSHPEAVVVALVGNVHARRVQGWRDDPSHTPMAFLLDDISLSLNMRYGRGEAWNCQSDGCGPHALGREGADLRVRLDWSATPEAYDGSWWIGTPTASPPAVKGSR